MDSILQSVHTLHFCKNQDPDFFATLTLDYNVSLFICFIFMQGM